MGSGFLEDSVQRQLAPRQEIYSARVSRKKVAHVIAARKQKGENRKWDRSFQAPSDSPLLTGSQILIACLKYRFTSGLTLRVINHSCDLIIF